MEAPKRKPGRPPNPEPRKETARIDIRVTPETLRRARIKAAYADMTLGEWVRQLVTDAARDQEATE
jgi:predicted HicB family RNase H-like nuclease